jgi:hypothetical protein
MNISAKPPQKDFGLKTLKRLSSHMSSLKSFSISSTPSTPSISTSTSMTELDSKMTSTSHLLQTKIDLSLNTVNSLSKPLNSLRSSLENQGSRLSKMLKLTRNKLSLTIDELLYDSNDLQRKVQENIDEKCVETKQHLNLLEKERKKNSEVFSSNFRENFQRMKYIIDKEANARASQSEVIVDQIDREVNAFDLQLKKNSNERKNRFQKIWSELEGSKEELEKELKMENEYRCKVQDKIIVLFEDACLKFKSKK